MLKKRYLTTDPAKIITTRGMWLYPTEQPDPFAVIPPPSEVAQWVSSKDVKTVYAGMTESAAGDATWVAWMRDLKTAMARDVKLYATQGQPDWADSGNTEAVSWANAVMALTDSAGQRLFRGTMLDVEPTWLFTPEDRTEVNMGLWRDMQTSVTSAVHGASSPNNSPPPESWATLQFWLDTLTLSGQAFDRVMLSQADGCSFMTYRDSVSGLLEVSRACVISGRITGKPIRLTVEANDAGEGPTVDYFGDSRAKMEADIGEVMKRLTEHSQNRHVEGVDVHDFDAWRDMSA